MYRYTYIWISYALFEELVAKDIDRCRAVYEKAIEIVPHKLFSFAKLWTLFVAFEVRRITTSAHGLKTGFWYWDVSLCKAIDVPIDGDIRKYISMDFRGNKSVPIDISACIETHIILFFVWMCVSIYPLDIGDVRELTKHQHCKAPYIYNIYIYT